MTDRYRKRITLLILVCGFALLILAAAFSTWLRSRADSIDPAVAAASRAYNDLERAHGVRGPRFEALALQINNSMNGGQKFTEKQLLTLLGHPDLTYNDPNQRRLLYAYNRVGTLDQAVVLVLTPSGQLKLMGYNVTSAMDLSFATMSTTQPNQGP